MVIGISVVLLGTYPMLGVNVMVPRAGISSGSSSVSSGESITPTTYLPTI